MHFSIPDTQEFFADGSNFHGFNVYVNGIFHCCLRYKQLHSLHDQLKRSLPTLILPNFPPKKLLTLTQNELEQRRIALERYLQLIGQDPVLSKSNLLRTFLLNAQQESAFIESYETNLDIYLMNGYRMTVNIYTTEDSVKVLEKSLKLIDLPDDYIYYFALFLIRKENDGGVTIVRRLMDFESPFITHKAAENCKIVIRKNYWDGSYDADLMRDRVSLNILYIQTLSDVERGWVVATNDIKEHLSTLQATGNKKDYMNAVKNLPSYGCIQFSNVLCDFPEASCMTTVIVGNQELGLRAKIGDKIQETKFKVTRMRCWRVTTILKDDVKKTRDRDGKCYTYELSFEYLMAKNSLKWIKLTTEQAMIISVCLQSMVDELVNQKSGYDVNSIQSHLSSSHQLDFIRRDENSNNGRLTDSVSDSSLNEMKNLTDAKTSIKQKIKQSISTSVFFRNGKASVQNEAFENIGDEDL